MRLMGLQAIYRAPRTSDPHPEHRVYPYLLKGMSINRSNQVWCADITYIPVCRGFLYLVAVMDWASRHVLAWRLSNTLDAGFCVEALDEALTRHGQPEIFNTDQGSQFTGFAFTGRLPAAGVRISMDGRGRCMDNVQCHETLQIGERVRSGAFEGADAECLDQRPNRGCVRRRDVRDVDRAGRYRVPHCGPVAPRPGVAADDEGHPSHGQQRPTPFHDQRLRPVAWIRRRSAAILSWIARSISSALRSASHSSICASIFLTLPSRSYCSIWASMSRTFPSRSYCSIWASMSRTFPSRSYCSI